MTIAAPSPPKTGEVKFETFPLRSSEAVMLF